VINVPVGRPGKHVKEAWDPEPQNNALTLFCLAPEMLFGR